jgi:hypothetical protein
MEPVDGAPCFFSGSLALGRCGLPTTDRLADCFAAGNGKIQGRVCHRWFTRGQRPPGLCDQRYTWAHLFAAVQPETGRSFALVLPELNTNAMQVFLDTFAATLAADEHGVIVMDQAGWHVTDTLIVPNNVSIVLQPSYSPELNPVERVWLFLRERHLSHRLLNTYEAILEALSTAWKALTAEQLISLTHYPYVKEIRI